MKNNIKIDLKECKNRMGIQSTCLRTRSTLRLLWAHNPPKFYTKQVMWLAGWLHGS